MATINGIGTVRYDWQSRADGTAEATVWIVVLLLPVIPLRRDHLKVVSTGIKRSGFLETLGAICGHAVGFQSVIEYLGPARLRLWGVLRTYFHAYVSLPFIAYLGPLLIVVFIGVGLIELGLDFRPWVNKFAPCFAIPLFLWAICFIASILDRSAGRSHVYVATQNDETNSGMIKPASAPMQLTERISKSGL
jgi:hypothetical protein